MFSGLRIVSMFIIRRWDIIRFTVWRKASWPPARHVFLPLFAEAKASTYRLAEALIQFDWILGRSADCVDPSDYEGGGGLSFSCFLISLGVFSIRSRTLLNQTRMAGGRIIQMRLASWETPIPNVCQDGVVMSPGYFPVID